MASIYLRGKTYWIKFSVNGRLVRESLKTIDPKIARYLLRKKEAELAEGRSPLPPQRVEPVKCIEEFLADTAMRKKPSTLRNDRLHLLDFARAVKVSHVRQITETIINDYLRQVVQERGLSPWTANGKLAVIQKWLTWCQRHRPPYVMENSALRVEGFARELNPGRFLSLDEIETVLTAFQGSHLYSMVATAIFSGLRVGELMHLEWRDIDFDRNTLMVQNKHEWQFKTKSRKFRVIPLNARLREILRPLAKPSGFCFLTPDGQRYQEQPKRAFYTVLKRAKIEGVGWHDLRRTFGSELARQGVSLLKISKWMGHSDPRVTVQHYAHLSPEFDEDINKIGAPIAQPNIAEPSVIDKSVPA